MTRSGLIIVDKPAGLTSHDVVDRIRRILGERRVGHAGTLDPFATGVLPVCFGTWTRLTGYLADHPKRYTARVRFGFATDTDDSTGRPIGEVIDSPAVDASGLARACRTFEGEIDQVVPVYSAKRVGGTRLYERARAGEAVEAPTTRVRVDAIDVVEAHGSEAVLDVRCAAGTYVRAIARDLGRSLGWGGHLVALRRTEAAGFDLAEAQTLDELVARGAEAPTIAPERVLAEWPALTLTDAEMMDVGYGRGFHREPSPPSPRLRLFSAEGDLVALADTLGGVGTPMSIIRPRVVLASRP